MANKKNYKKMKKNTVSRKRAQHMNNILREQKENTENIPSSPETNQCNNERVILGDLTNAFDNIGSYNYDPYERRDISQTGSGFSNIKCYSGPKCKNKHKKDKNLSSNSTIEDSSENRRIVDLNYFLQSLKHISNHSPIFGCTLLNLDMVSETRLGILSKIKFKCNMCGQKFIINTANPNPRENLDINTAAVSATTATGIGYSQLKEIFSNINVPIMSQKLFENIHVKLCEEWEKTAFESMEVAAKKERDAAIAEGSTKDGIAVIDVIADGCWSKRSYKSNYNANSGAAAIIGAKFRQVLYLGLRNKYCSICSRAQNKGIQPKEHKCYKNYSGSSTSMESDILVEGFKNSISMHNIIYGRLIADGDSSTYNKLIEARPYKNVTIEKIECRNHLLRNMCNKLSALTKETKYILVHRKMLTTQRTLAMRKAISLAIKNHKNNGNLDSNLQDLRKRINKLYCDISNSCDHAFGDHTNCQTYYCSSDNFGTNTGSIVDQLTTSALWIKIKFIIGVVASNSRSLINDVDTNAVEHFHSIVCKFVGGKRTNLIQRQTYNSRCAGAVVSFNTKKPLYNLQKHILGVKPKSKIVKFEEKRLQNNIIRCMKQRKINFTKNVPSQQDKDYGNACMKPDLTPEDYITAKDVFLKKLEKTYVERNNIQKATILQRESGEWLELRRQLLTASNFGRVIKKRNNTPSANIIKDLLYKSNISNVASIKYGIENESIAIRQLSLQEKIDIEKCGLFIDSEIPFLGATPDGLIGDHSVVEIKCPMSTAKLSILEAKKKLGFWTIKDGRMVINKNHNWYYQIQGQLHISQRKTCLLAVWLGENVKMIVERIDRDDGFWKGIMIDKLNEFYINEILPELVDPRQTRNMPLRNSKIKKRKTPEQPICTPPKVACLGLNEINTISDNETEAHCQKTRLLSLNEY